MRIHREGRNTILLLSLLIAIKLFWAFSISAALGIFALLVSFAFMIFILRFFRYPERPVSASVQENEVLAPCDGKVVVIEKVFEPEFYKAERIQVSVFMNPNNVHVNWCSIAGKILFAKYHPGKHLVAWHPKSSTDNERTTIVIENDQKKSILLRQIAGAVARRVVYYMKEGMTVSKGQELGFIKFGSRMDLFLPLDAKINVQLNQIVEGNGTIIASI